MNKNQAIEYFIKSHLDFLLNPDKYDRDDLKKYKKEFFIEKYKVGNPKDREIALRLLPMVIKTEKIYSDEALQLYIDNNPFLKYCNINSKEFHHLIKRYKVDLSDYEKVKDLSEQDRIKKLKESIIEKEAAEISAEVDKIKKEKEILEKELESILDNQKFIEPDNYDYEDSPLEWWEQLNLKSNPFPNTNGLTSIDENLYEKILVGTEPFQWMLKKLSTSSLDFFDKGYLIEGALGTGKTTFYDFFKPRFLMKNIEPLKIIITEKVNIAQYNIELESQLLKTLRRVCQHKNLHNTSDDFEEIMFSLCQDKAVEGFVIFIEDLHKHSKYELVFQFLSNLQLYKNRLVEYKIKSVFFVSGLPEWRSRIHSDQKLNSFFDGSFNIIMPEVDPNRAAEAINKRIKAFSKNPNRDIPINKNFLNYIFASEQKKHTIVGYRVYIDSAKKHLENKHFDIIGLKPTRLETKLLTSIKTRLESDYYFSKSFNKLRYSGGQISNQTLSRCIDLVRKIYIEKYISEFDKLFNDKRNLELLKRLRDSKLIIKSSAERGAWKVHPSLEEINIKVISEFKVSLEDYLIQIYGDKSLITKSAKNIPVSNKFKSDIEELRASLSAQDYSQLDDILSQYLNNIYFSEEADSFEYIVNNNELTIKKIEDILFSLSILIIRTETPNIVDLFAKEICWNKRFRILEYFPDFQHLLRNIKDDFKNDRDAKARLISSANKAFEELWNELKLSLTTFSLNNKIPFSRFLKPFLVNLTNLIEFISNSSIESEKFFDLFKKFKGSVETGFKEYLFISTKLIFGDNRHLYYPHIRNINRSNIEFTGSVESFNEYQALERSAFKEIFINTNNNNQLFNKYVIEPITKNWAQNELNSFYTIFSQTDQILSHDEKEKVIELNKRSKSFISLSCILLDDLILHLKKLILENSFIFQIDSRIFVVYGFKPRIKSASPICTEVKYINEIPDCFSRYEITDCIKNDLEIFLNDFFDNGLLEVELTKIEELKRIGIPGASYAEQLGFIQYLIQTKKVLLYPLYGTSVILKKI